MSKIAIITGASRGLGAVIVREFTDNGWHVVGTGRSPKPADFPEEAEYRQFDASDPETATALFQELHTQTPEATFCLVNNAGGYTSGSLLETKPEDYEQQMKSCFFASVYMTQGLARSIPKARIINVISNSALAAHKNNSAYGAAKAAEMHFFQALQQEFKAEQYQITNLYPSDIASHGPNPAAIEPKDLANFILAQAENTTSYYLRDITIYPQS